MNFAAASKEDRVAIIQALTAEPNEPKELQRAASLVDGIGSLQEAAELMSTLKADGSNLASQVLGHLANDDKAAAIVTRMEELATSESPASATLDLDATGRILSRLEPKKAAELLVKNVIPKFPSAAPASSKLEILLSKVSNENHRSAIKQEVESMNRANQDRLVQETRGQARSALV